MHTLAVDFLSRTSHVDWSLIGLSMLFGALAVSLFGLLCSALSCTCAARASAYLYAAMAALQCVEGHKGYNDEVWLRVMRAGSHSSATTVSPTLV